MTVAYIYDLNGNRLTMDDGVLGITTYLPDALNRLTSLTAPGQAAISDHELISVTIAPAA